VTVEEENCIVLKAISWKDKPATW